MRKRVFYYIFGLILFHQQSSLAQLYGSIKDSNGQPLPYASIYIQGSTIGTLANEKGLYELALKTGTYKIVFQYTGYEKLEREVHYNVTPVKLDIVLNEAIYKLGEITFSSKKEDPAYDIIRRTIANRKKYEQWDHSYTCESYTKGSMRILNAPNKILGQNIGNMDGNLDSNRQGIVYLSESISEISFEKPNTIKEIMISSKVSGDDNGFSFNRAGALNFNLYQNVTPFSKDIISPISDYALNHYKYKLLGTYTNENNQSVHKIRMIPKIREDAVWSGDLYILDQAFVIYSFDGYIRGGQIKQALFDTIFLNQNHFSIGKDSFWRVQNQLFKFKAGLLGITLEGNFSIFYKNIQINDTLKIQKKNETLEILKGSNVKSQLYWDSIRPMPLTIDEQLDYLKKDSLKLIKASKHYLDSTDRISNQFKWLNLLMGYTYSKSYKQRFITYKSPVNSLAFNPVQGTNVMIALRLSQYLDKDLWYHKWTGDLDLAYGFSNKRLNVKGTIYYRFNPFKNMQLRWTGGSILSEFNSYQNVSSLYNTFSSLLNKNNALKLFQQDFIQFDASRDINYSIRSHFSLFYINRSSVSNQSQYSWLKKDELYIANQTTEYGQEFLKIGHQRLLKTNIRFEIQPYSKVWKTPNGITNLGSDWPKINLKATLGYYVMTKEHFLKYEMGINQQISWNRWGASLLTITGSLLDSKSPMDVVDQMYINGNAFAVYSLPELNNYFLGWGLYRIIEPRYLLTYHVEHDFKGILLDRIPGINRLGWVEHIRFSGLVSSHESGLQELSIGFGNIGYGAFRFFRMDWVQVFENFKRGPSYLRFGINQTLSVGR